MSYAQRQTVAVTTAADGSATAYSSVVTGKLSQIHYVKTDFDDGVDFTITAEATGETLWAEPNVNDSTVRAPRHSTHASDGSVTPAMDKIALAGDRVQIVIAAGGDSKTGTFILVFE